MSPYLAVTKPSLEPRRQLGSVVSTEAVTADAGAAKAAGGSCLRPFGDTLRWSECTARFDLGWRPKGAARQITGVLGR